MKIPVLLYHSIDNDNSPVSLNLADFEKHLLFLRKNNFISTDLNKLDEKNKKNIIITFDDGYKDNFLKALPLLKKYNYTAICYIVTSLIGKNNYWDNNKKEYSKKELMSESDIVEWTKNGMEIGSHSHNHDNLTTLNNNEICDDLIKSKDKLENIIGKNIYSFSYPFGRINHHVYNNVKKIYKNAVTINRSRYNTLLHDKFLIPRIDMGRKLSSFKIYLKLRTIYEDIKYNENELQV
tara:strand:- start:1683 stop:2393 length:711 start_codon:yes stop_codon:yes gene_type:complete